MELKDNEAVCSCCGSVDYIYFMKKIGIGRRVRYLCEACYQNGRRAADGLVADWTIRTKEDIDRWEH